MARRRRTLRVSARRTAHSAPRTLTPHLRTRAGDDILDEIFGYFKANVLFKHFEVKGPADRVLIYITLYITKCLQRLEKCPNAMEGLKALTTMAHETFRTPGEVGFALGSFFPSPANSAEGGAQPAPPRPNPPDPRASTTPAHRCPLPPRRAVPLVLQAAA